MPDPVTVDVVHILPEGWGMCLTCEAFLAQADLGGAPHTRGLNEYPPEWREDFQRFSDVIFGLAARYGEQVRVRIFDARSLQGIWKALRYNIHKYPAFIVAGREKVIGLDEARISSAIEKCSQK